MAFFDEFSDLVTTTLVATPVTRDGRGKIISRGTPVDVDSYDAPTRGSMVKLSNGREVVSKVEFICDPSTAAGLTTDAHVYELPSDYDPSVDQEPLEVVPIRDPEDGTLGYVQITF